MNPLPSSEKMASLVSGVTQTMLGLTFVPDTARAPPNTGHEELSWRTAVLPIAGERPLPMDSCVLPFRPAASWHWFAHEGVLRRFDRGERGARLLDREYSDALTRGTVRVLLVDPDLVAAYLPKLDRLLLRSCRLLLVGYADHDAYVCHLAPRA